MTRVARVMEALKFAPSFSANVVSLLESDAMEQRAAWQRRRARDDDWFFQRFTIPV
jgi:hypothetical protein